MLEGVTLTMIVAKLISASTMIVWHLSIFKDPSTRPGNLHVILCDQILYEKDVRYSVTLGSWTLGGKSGLSQVAGQCIEQEAE